MHVNMHENIVKYAWKNVKYAKKFDEYSWKFNTLKKPY